jgi:hypothetical protein
MLRPFNCEYTNYCYLLYNTNNIEYHLMAYLYRLLGMSPNSLPQFSSILMRHFSVDGFVLSPNKSLTNSINDAGSFTEFQIRS